jgi:hypothetical protein
MKDGIARMTTDRLMLPRDKGLEAFWGNTAQDEWGKLTNIAILMTIKKLQNKEFKTLVELYVYLAKFRALIGTALNQNATLGELRRCVSFAQYGAEPMAGMRSMPFTPIDSTAARSKNYFLEFDKFFHFSFDNLIALRGNLFARALNFLGLIPADNKDMISNGYTSIRKISPQQYQIWHCQNIDEPIKLAEECFQKLTEQTLTDEDKNLLIEKICFYLANAMPCEEGSASIAEMLFYVLKDVFTGEMVYLQKGSSQFGCDQGVPVDIAAMLSQDFDDFKKYLENQIINHDIQIIKKETQIENADEISFYQLLKEIEEMLHAIKKYRSNSILKLSDNEQMLKAFETLNQLLLENEHNFCFLKAIHYFKESLIKAAQSKFLYYIELHHDYFNITLFTEEELKSKILDPLVKPGRIDSEKAYKILAKLCKIEPRLMQLSVNTEHTTLTHAMWEYRWSSGVRELIDYALEMNQHNISLGFFKGHNLLTCAIANNAEEAAKAIFNKAPHLSQYTIPEGRHQGFDALALAQQYKMKSLEELIKAEQAKEAPEIEKSLKRSRDEVGEERSPKRLRC